MNAFDDYAPELSLLAGTANPLPALLSRRDPRPWRRTYARFHPHEPSYCTFLYEAQTEESPPLPLRVSLYRDAAAAPGGEVVAGLGVAHIAPPTADEALDTLEAVLSRHTGASIVRYRPGHRCTFRAVHAQARVQYVKVFASSAIAPHLAAGMQALWQCRGDLGFAVAQPLEVDHDLRFASQAALPGTPLIAELLGPRGLEVAAAIGHAAATLPTSSVAAVTPADGDDTVERTAWYAQSIAALLPEYTDRLGSLVSRLEYAEAACAPARRLPIHGGLHPSQWLRCGDGPPPDRSQGGPAPSGGSERSERGGTGPTPGRSQGGPAPSGGSERSERGGMGPTPGRSQGGPAPSGGSERSERGGMRLGLVDFDRLGLGDPELDVATFVTELRYEGTAAVPAAQLCQAFTDAYAQHVPLDARRIELYAAHKEAAKLMRLARQPRPDAPRRFARALEEIEQAHERIRAA